MPIEGLPDAVAGRAVRPPLRRVRKGAMTLWVVMACTLVTELYDVAYSPFDMPAKAAAFAVFAAASLVFLHGLSRRTLADVLRNSPHALLLCFLYLLTAIVTVAKGATPPSTLGLAASYAATAFVCLTIVPLGLVRRGILGSMFLALAAMGLISSLVGIFAAATGANSFLGLTMENGLKMSSLGFFSTAAVFRQRTAYAAQVFLGLVGFSYYLRPGVSRTLPLLGIGVCAVGLLVSWARGPWLGSFVAAAVWLSVGATRRFKALILSVGAGGLAVLGLLVATQAPLVAEFLIVDRGLSGREVFWPVAIQAIRDEPVFGHGLQSGWEVKLEYAADQLNRDRMEADRGSGFHNFILDTGVAMGLPTVAMVLATIGMGLRRLGRSRLDLSLKKTISAGIAGMVVIAFFTTYNLGGVRNPSLVMGLLLGLANCSPWFVGGAAPGSARQVRSR